jgi:UDP:flavonoid glycosyltransferase YjiC (YdhE family)
VRPALPLARELVAAGHDVVWYSGRKFQGLIENVGAKFLPTNADLDFDEEEFDVLHDMADRKPGLSGLRAMVLELFIRPMPHYAADLGPLLDEIAPEVVVDCFMAGPLLARQRGIGSVVYTVGR